MGEQRTWFLEMKLTPGEYAVDIVQMTTKAITESQSIKQGLRGLTPILKEGPWVKMLSNSITDDREIVYERKS